ncbi:MAG: hypothetical protein ACFB21_03055 [Opitutales bacterium]
MSPTKKQILALTGGFLAAYLLMRSLPVEPCEVLHTEKLDNAGVAEFCGPDEADYYPVTQMRFPVQAAFSPDGPLEARQRTRTYLTLTAPGGYPLDVSSIATSHGEKVHLMLVDPSLDDYFHLHPAPTDEPGVFAFDFEPRQSGTYQAFLEFVSAETTRRILLADSLEVRSASLAAAVPSSAPAPAFAGLRPVSVGELQVRLTGLPEPGMRPGERFTFGLEVSHPDRDALTFEPVMNSYAHLVVFDADRVGLAHAHPLDFNLATQPAVNPPLRFSVRLPEAGDYRLWAQFQIDGKLHQAPFDLKVR